MPVTRNSLQVAISPCPNDTFSFYHFLNDSENRGKYEVVFHDIEELNRGMIAEKWDVVKASFPVALKLHKQYDLLPSGSAIGFGVGPIAIYGDESVLSKEEWIVGLPGENTTANFLWKYFLSHTGKALPNKLRIIYMNFSEVIKKTASGEIDVGVVIHEGRFVYQKLRLNLFEDLGKFWHDTTGYPIPLGGIFIRSSLAEKTRKIVVDDLKQSIQKALYEKGRQSEIYIKKILPFIKEYSQELSIDVIEQHIQCYVNADTIELSESSRTAIQYFWKTFEQMSSITENKSSST